MPKRRLESFPKLLANARNRARYRNHRPRSEQRHRLVEIGCVELLNRIPTGATFHAYLNPDRDMPAEAFAVHGLSIEFLKAHKRFHEVVDEFLAFIGDARRSSSTTPASITASSAPNSSASSAR